MTSAHQITIQLPGDFLRREGAVAALASQNWRLGFGRDAILLGEP